MKLKLSKTLIAIPTGECTFYILNTMANPPMADQDNVELEKKKENSPGWMQPHSVFYMVKNFLTWMLDFHSITKTYNTNSF